MKEYIVKKGDAFAGRPFSFVFWSVAESKAGITFADNSIYKEQRRFALHVLRDLGFSNRIIEV